jgi:hypothetical protein
VCSFVVDGAWQGVLHGQAFRPSVKSSITGVRVRQTASCAGFLSQSRGKPADLAAIGILDPRVAKFPNDRERFAQSQVRLAPLPARRPVLCRKDLP